MKHTSIISTKMKDDWDRRVSADFRFWMSDGVASDTEMWESGERDFKIIFGSLLSQLKDKKALEIGCGVGRLIYSASKYFNHITGIDVSGEAIKKAREFLADVHNVTLIEGDGITLEPIKNEDLDVVFAFGSLMSCPAIVTAGYLNEINRVLKVNGTAILQLYFGNEQSVYELDTLHLRCYHPDRFKEALEKCGFNIIRCNNLEMPFEASAPSLGVNAIIIEIEKVAISRIDTDELLATISGLVEKSTEQEVDMGLEAWMCYQYAKRLIEWGDINKAIGTLNYAINTAKNNGNEIKQLLNNLSNTTYKDNFFSLNTDIFNKRFPNLINFYNRINIEYTVEFINENPIFYKNFSCLDHPTQPEKAAIKWVDQVAQDTKNLIVYGFGGGYHLQALMELRPEIKCTVVEPDIELINIVFKHRDFSGLLNWIHEFIITDIPADWQCDDQAQLLIRPQTLANSGKVAKKLQKLVYGSRGKKVLRPSFAVVGPFEGGTLPISYYVNDALRKIEQRSYLIDMSDFQKPYLNMDNEVRDKNGLKIMQLRYLEFMSSYILQRLQEKPVDILFCMPFAPVTPKLLNDLRASGMITALWFVEDFSRFTFWQQYVKAYDFIFTIQKDDCLKQMQDAGAHNISYVPMAADLKIHKPVTLTDSEKKRFGSPVSFVGAGYYNRTQVFASLASYPLKIWGSEWPTMRPFDKLVQENGRRIAVNEYVKIFNASAINLNLHSSNERDTIDPKGDFINPRTFEIAACGAFQLVDERLYLPDCFTPGYDIITFRDVADLKNKINYYLNHEQERNIIAERSRQKVIKFHTYEHRLEEIITEIYSSKYYQLKKRFVSSPWKKLLEKSKNHSELESRCNKAFVDGATPDLDGLVQGILKGEGDLSKVEQKLLFLFHIERQVIQMRQEEIAGAGRSIT
jgi:spore maturation protein CgeB